MRQVGLSLAVRKGNALPKTQNFRITSFNKSVGTIQSLKSTLKKTIYIYTKMESMVLKLSDLYVWIK